MEQNVFYRPTLYILCFVLFPCLRVSLRFALSPNFPDLTLLYYVTRLDQYTTGLHFPRQLGGQNCYFEEGGAYTGAVSTAMLESMGCEYVLCGHSERRT